MGAVHEELRQGRDDAPPHDAHAGQVRRQVQRLAQPGHVLQRAHVRLQAAAAVPQPARALQGRGQGDEQVAEKSLPAVGYLKIPDDGDPYLEGHKCGNCGAVFLGERSVCSKCFSRDKISAIKLQETGILHSFSVVYRSFPGIDVPYVSAIVDLDGGGTVKGNLINIEPDPEKIDFGMKVKLTYQDALGRKDKEGNSYLSYFFEPA